ncbi:tubby C-terminal-like domain-containing protein [Nemania sp. NC0429]|nr:tubby C-terminal-like domain-containing protein [Nemania sp. NC0429]
MSNPEMQPYSMKLGVYERFCASREETLVLEENALSPSAGTFDIAKSDGEILFRVESRTAWPSGYRTRIIDYRSNTLLFAIGRNIVGSGFYAKGPDDKTILKIKDRSSETVCSFMSFLRRSEALINEPGRPHAREEIKDKTTGQIIALMSRSSLVGLVPDRIGRQTYTVTVAQGVDMALVVAMCFCLDDMLFKATRTD